MTTRFELTQDIDADVDDVAEALRDQERIEERLATEAAAHGRLSSLDGSREVWQLIARGVVPLAWMPAAAFGMMGPPMIRREKWTRYEDGERTRLDGRLRIEIVGAPVHCEATLRVDPVTRGSRYTLDMEIRVFMLMVGPSMELGIRGQIIPALRREMALLATQAAAGT